MEIGDIRHLRRRFNTGTMFFAALMGALLAAPCSLNADTIFLPSLNSLLLQNINADGTATVSVDGFSFVLVGGNTGSGVSGETDFLGLATTGGTWSFDWSYSSLDTPGFDAAGYILGGNKVQLSNADGESGSVSVMISAGQQYGWYVSTQDNTGEPGQLSVTVNNSMATATPEPSTWLLLGAGLTMAMILQSRRRRAVMTIALATLAGGAATAQTQNHYTAASVTGQLTLARVVNPSEIAAALTASAAEIRARGGEAQAEAMLGLRDRNEIMKLPLGMPRLRLTNNLLAGPSATAADLPVITTGPQFGFQGLSHYDQRNADSGNQLTIEPPNPSVAFGNGFILEGVNNAVRVFDEAGKPLLPTLSSNQWFGLDPSFNRSTNVYGPYPTDMRVYFDPDINRWFVLQRAQDNNSAGQALDQSHFYLAVSATADPTAAWNIYVMDTTDAANSGCPCLADYPIIGSDQYGIYISANEYNTTFVDSVDAIILAISKTQLAAAAAAPTTWRFNIPLITDYEFSIHPATTPPGASKFIASGGVEYFASTAATTSTSSEVAIWAMSNTASLSGPNTSLLLTQTLIPTEWYFFPGVASQRPGPIPYGSSLSPPGQLEYIDGNPDSRVQSLSYAGGRLYLTLPTQVTDSMGNSVVGGAYMIISPTFRNGTLAGTILSQGYLAAAGNHLLRPAIAVNASGKGAIVFTVTGPDYFPTAAFTTIDVNNPPTVIQVLGTGAAPEDGFTGYFPSLTAPVARWGDYSTSTAAADGSIWMVTEYIPGGLRTTGANWGTYIAQYVP